MKLKIKYKTNVTTLTILLTCTILLSLMSDSRHNTQHNTQHSSMLKNAQLIKFQELKGYYHGERLKTLMKSANIYRDILKKISETPSENINPLVVRIFSLIPDPPEIIEGDYDDTSADEDIADGIDKIKELIYICHKARAIHETLELLYLQ